MSNLLSLSLELKVIIFEILEDLDDAVHLARTCKIFHGVYYQYKPTILWAIIKTAHHHIYDLNLCRMYDDIDGVDGKLESVFLSMPTYHVDHLHGCKSQTNQAQLPKPKVPDMHLEKILRWWQHTSWLRNIYLNNMQAYLSVLSFVESRSMAPKQQQQYAFALVLDRQASFTGHFQPSLPDRFHSHVCKRKFYRAVMGRFLDTTALRYDTLSQASEIPLPLSGCIYDVSPERSLREALEILEAFDFLSNFLVLHILQEPQILLDWGCLLSDEEREALVWDHNDTLLNNWIHLFERLQPYLSPFDILAIFLMDELDRDTIRYLVSLVMLEKNDRGHPVMVGLETEVFTRLKDGYSVPEKSWKTFRRHGWRHAVRGAIFNQNLDVGIFVHKITEFKDLSPEWWTFLEQDPNHAPHLFYATLPGEYLMNFTALLEDSEGGGITLFVPEDWRK